MSRIKFRYWDTKHLVMVEGPTVYDNADHLGLGLHEAGAYYTDEQMEGDDNHIYGGDDWIFIMNDFELLQFTGLTDKNGKEIYDGDIVRTDVNGKLWVVMFGNFGWKFCNHRIKEPKHKMAGDEEYFFYEYLPMLKKAGAYIEVVGNVYSNP